MGSVEVATQPNDIVVAVVVEQVRLAVVRVDRRLDAVGVARYARDLATGGPIVVVQQHIAVVARVERVQEPRPWSPWPPQRVRRRRRARRLLPFPAVKEQDGQDEGHEREPCDQAVAPNVGDQVEAAQERPGDRAERAQGEQRTDSGPRMRQRPNRIAHRVRRDHAQTRCTAQRTARWRRPPQRRAMIRPATAAAEAATR